MDVPLTPEEQEKFDRAKPSWMKEGLFPSMPDRIIGSPPSSISRTNISRRLSPMLDAPLPDDYNAPPQGCSIRSVNVVFNATDGVDFGYGTARPVQMTADNYFTALDWHDANPGVIPIPTLGRMLTINVTPPCSPTDNVNNTGSPVFVGRVVGTCYRSRAENAVTASGSGTFEDASCPGDCPPECTMRDAFWGADGLQDEQIDFGDVATPASSWDDAQATGATIWVTYLFSAIAQWNCGASACESTPGTPCLDGGGNPCNPAPPGSTGDVCANVLPGSPGDPSTPAPGTTSQVDLVFGDGSTWTTTAGTLSLYIGNTAVTCASTPGFEVTY